MIGFFCTTFSDFYALTELAYFILSGWLVFADCLTVGALV